MAQKKNSKKKNNALLATATVVLGLLVILIIFLAKKDQIKTNLKETAFFEKVVGSTPQFIENHEVEKSPAEDEVVPLKEDVTIRIESVQPVTPKNEQEDFVTATPEPKAEPEKPAASKDSAKTEVKKEAPKKAETKAEEPKKAATTDLELCFVIIDGDGSVLRKQIKRTVPKSDSPLTTAINLLLQGPDTTKAAEKNCMTLIPDGTRLISAKVQGGVAYLNFTEEFQFNGLGIDGQIHQLEQIVYTATAFSTVNSVQFMIEGKTQDYLGEGVWIGSPLSRASF